MDARTPRAHPPRRKLLCVAAHLAAHASVRRCSPASVSPLLLCVLLFCILAFVPQAVPFVGSGDAQAETLTMTLDAVGVSDCDVPWTEGSCVLRVTDTTMGDYTPPGFCLFFPQAEGLALLGARLEIDVAALHGIESVEIDLREVSDAGRTRAFVYAEGDLAYFDLAMSSYTGGATEQTFVFDVAGYELGRIAVSAHEALIEEVRLIGATMVALPDPSWGVIKAHW